MNSLRHLHDMIPLIMIALLVGFNADLLHHNPITFVAWQLSPVGDGLEGLSNKSGEETEVTIEPPEEFTVN